MKPVSVSSNTIARPRAEAVVGPEEGAEEPGEEAKFAQIDLADFRIILVLTGWDAHQRHGHRGGQADCAADRTRRHQPPVRDQEEAGRPAW